MATAVSIVNFRLATLLCALLLPIELVFAQNEPPTITDEQRDAVRTAFANRGLPTSLRELDDSYPRVPDNENAAIWYLKTAERLRTPQTQDERELPIISGTYPHSGVVMDDAMLQTARIYLNIHANTRRFSHEGAKLNKSRYPVDLSLGVDMALLHLSRPRDLVRVLGLEAIVRAYDDDNSGAVDSIESIYAIASSFENEPLLISQAVRCWIESLSAEVICNCISIGQFTPEQLDRLGRAADSGINVSSFRRALVGETVIALFDPEVRNNTFSAVGERSDLGSFARIILPFLDALNQPLREAILEAEALAGAPGLLDERGNPITALESPQLIRSYYGLVRILIYRKLLRSIIAIEKYRIDHNSVPEDLVQLVPKYLSAIPEDPLGEGFLRYARTQSGYTVYSIGFDRVDGGGEHPRDITLSVTR